ncbi:MAG: hypothetical protein ACLFSB_16155 [Chitinispirillaceae bacterium]
MSLLYGIGSVIPVVVFAVILAFAAQMIGSVFNALTSIEIWVRRATAVVMYVLMKGVWFSEGSLTMFSQPTDF